MMRRRRKNARKSFNQRQNQVPVQLDTLEKRALLAAVVEAIQIDGQAPDVLAESGDVRLLYLQDTDSTRLFSTDGTQSGTTELRDIPGLFDAHDVLGTVNGRVVFRVQSESTLWTTDGTDSGTTFKSEFDLPPRATSTDPVNRTLESAEFNGELYFSGKATEQEGFELWKTDGTAGGTTLVNDINRGQIGLSGQTFSWDAVAGAVSYDVSIQAYGVDFNAGNFGGGLTDAFFTAEDVAQTWQQVEIDVSTITPAGAGQVINPAHFLLTTTPNFGDGSTGDAVTSTVRIVSDIDLVSSHPSDFAVFNGELYFAAEDPLLGRELFKTDGQSVTNVGDLVSGPGGIQPVHLLEFDGSLFFGSNHDHDLYKTDGTLDGTVRVLEGEGVSHAYVTPWSGANSASTAQQVAGSFPIAVVSGKLVAQQMGNGAGSKMRRLVSFASAADTSPTDLGVVGSSAVEFPFPGSVDYFDGFTEVNDRLVFRKSSYSTSTDGGSGFGHLLATDGTTSEILIDQQLWAEHHTGKRILSTLGKVVGTQLYLTTQSVVPHLGSAANTAVYRTDGTAAGSLEISSNGFLDAGNFLRYDQYLTVGDDAYVLRPQNTDPTVSTLWDLYMIDTTGLGQTLVDDNLNFEISPTSPLAFSNGLNDLNTAELFEFNNALFVKLPTDDGNALFTIGDGPSDGPITVTGGVGLQETATPTLTWPTPPRTVDRYDIFINALGNRSSSVYRRTNITSATHTLEVGLPDGNYEVWLRAYYRDGIVSKWGDQPALMTLASGLISSGPPSIISPAAFSTDTQPVFSWTATQGALSYEIWVSDALTTVPIVRAADILANAFTSDTSFAPGTYRAWVRAKLADGLTGWSGVKRFHIQHAAIAITGGVGVQAELTPTITWEDPGNVDRFELYIREAGGTGPAFRRSDLSTNSYTLESPLQDGGNYLVWVRAHFADGSSSRWGSEGALLMIRSDDGQLRMISPTGRVETERPTFTWTALGAAVDTYELRVTPVGSSTPVFVVSVAESASATNATLESYEHDTDFQTGEYTSEVRALFDDGSVSEWTTPEAFSVRFQPPEITGGVGDQTTGSPTITWTALPGVTSYELYIREVGNAVPAYRRSGLTATSHTLEETLPNGAYDVWVRAILSDGTPTIWGEAKQLFVGDTASFENADPGLTIVNGRASWSSIAGATAYEFHVDGTNPFRWRLLYANNLTGTDLQLALEAGTYRAWIRAIGPNGETGRFSSWVEFEIVGNSRATKPVEGALDEEIQLASIESLLSSDRHTAEGPETSATVETTRQEMPEHLQLSDAVIAMIMENAHEMDWLDDLSA